MGYDVLIVDDNEVDAGLMQTYLKRSSLPIETIELVCKQEMYIQRLKSEKYDLILSDYKLVQFTGEDTIKLKNRYSPETPLVIVSGTLGEEKAVALIKSGASDFLLKSKIKSRLVQVSQRAIAEAEEKKKRRKAEQTLRENEKRYRLLAENATDMISRHNLAGDYLYASPASQQLTGYEPAELEGTNAYDFIHPEDYSKIKHTHEAIVSDREELMKVSYRIKQKEGGWRWVQTVSKTLADADTERPNEILAITRDISERIKYEQQLHKQYELNEQIINSLPELFFIISSDQKLLRVNQQFRGSLGYEGVDLKKIHPLHFVAEDEREKAAKHLKQAFMEGHTELELNLITADGQLIPYYVTGIVNELDGDNYVLGTGIDISERVQYENELETAVKEKEVLLMEIHHRVKNNLAVISGMMQMQAYECDNEEAYDALMNSQNRIKSIAIIHELLYQEKSFSQIQFQKNTLQLVDQLAEANDPDQQIQVETNLEPIHLNVNQAIPCSLILNELLTNVYKHAFKNGEQGRIELNLKEENHQVFLEVTDNGSGFDPQSNNNGSKSVGLNIVEVLTNQLQGSLETTSNANGTKTVLTFEKANVKGPASHLIN